MDRDSIERRRREIIGRYGPWTAHNIHLCDDVYTIGNHPAGDEVKLRRIVQMVSDAACAPLKELRILDLACLEGLYAVEFARHGAEVTAIEVREANIEKARFSKDVLSLDRLRLCMDDVRNLSEDKYGLFDVVLCLGILYHLDAPDLFSFTERMASVCKRFAIVDTHISKTGREYAEYKGRKYYGRAHDEHSLDSSPEERLKSLWSSIDNIKSFWLTRPSLYALLFHAGFSSVYECHVPAETGKPSDRVTFLAIKGKRETLLSSQMANATLSEDDFPEHETDPSADSTV